MRLSQIQINQTADVFKHSAVLLLEFEMTCESCNRPWHTQAVSGVVGLAKNVLGIEQVSDDVWAARLNACRSCAHLQRFQATLPPSADLGLLDRCQLCGCLVKEKAKLIHEKCPLDLWGGDVQKTGE